MKIHRSAFRVHRSEEEWRAWADVILELAERLVAHEEGEERVHVIAAREEVTYGGFVDQRHFEAAFGEAERMGVGFGVGEGGGNVGSVQQGKGAALDSGVPVSDRLPVPAIKETVSIRHQPRVIDVASMAEEGQVNVAQRVEGFG